MLALLLGALLAPLAACHDKPAAPAASGPPGTASQPRRVDVRVSNLGYTPARISGRPGESLVLAFHYESSAGECGREVIIPAAGGAETKLRLDAGKAVEARVRLPDSKGELTFTCGMNMLTGSLVAE